MAETENKTREEIFGSASFEWVKTDRSGDLCTFSHFEAENGIEYTSFTDGTRIRTDLIGDIVLMHNSSFEVLGREMIPVAQVDSFSQPVVLPNNDTILNHLKAEQTPIPQQAIQVVNDPVVSILEKTKKKTEKIALTITVKIPSPELYGVIRENFENVDEILLQNVMDQIQEAALREAVKKELQNIYTKKRKA